MDEKTNQLLVNMQAGDEQAFDQIYRTYARKLYRTAFLISGNKEDSEDILQETFVKCFLHCSEIKSPAYFERWLMKIMVRISWRVVKQQRSTISSDELLSNDEYAGFAEALFEDKHAKSPLEQVVNSEEQALIITAVKDLDLKLRTVIILYYFEELTVREIAAVTGSLEGTVKSRLYHARKKLALKLGRTNKSIKEVRGNAG